MNFKKTLFALALGSVGITGAMSAHAVSITSLTIQEIGTASGNLGSSGASAVAGTFYFQTISGTQPAGGDVGYNFVSAGTTSGNIISTAGQGDLTFATAFKYDGQGGTSTAGAYDFNANSCGNQKPCHTSSSSTLTTGVSASYLGAGANVSSIDLSNWGGFFTPFNRQFLLNPTVSPGAAYTQLLTFTTSALGAGGLPVSEFYYTADWSHYITTAENVSFGTSIAVWHLEGIGCAELDGVCAGLFPPAPVPEPETYAMMMAGLGLVGFMARRRKQHLATV